MAARVAFLVEDRAALAQALQAFVEGRADARVRLPGCDRTDSRLEECAARWLAGGEVDWTALYDGAPPRRIHAPGTCFARERHWLDLSLGGKDPAPVPHPLLQRNVSQLGRQAYRSRFGGSEFFWAEHRVGDAQVLPGVACLEMARAAWEHATGSSREASLALAFDGLVWTQPIRAGEAPVAVEIRLAPRDGGQVAFEIAAGAAGRVPDMQGTLRPAAMAAATTRDLEQLRSAAVEAIEPAALYRRLRASGMQHGPSFQAVAKAWRGDGYVLASLKLPRRLRATLATFALHPVLLDAAIQAWVGFDLAAAAPGGAAVPFACRRIEVAGACEETMWAVLTPCAGTAADAALRRFDLALCDRTGAVRVQFHELALRVLGEAAARELVWSVPRWQEHAAGPTGEAVETRIFTAGLAAAGAALAARALPPPGEPAATAQQWFRLLRQDIAEALRAGPAHRLQLAGAGATGPARHADRAARLAAAHRPTPNSHASAARWCASPAP